VSSASIHFEVDDVDRAVAELKEAGFRTLFFSHATEIIHALGLPNTEAPSPAPAAR
jgi:hypothetical protein